MQLAVQAIQSQLTVPRVPIRGRGDDAIAMSFRAAVNGALQVEMRCQRRKVISVVIHVVVVCGLGRATMATAVMGYDAIAVFEEKQHLRVPVIGRQRPAVAEHDGWPLPQSLQ
jgi:hypothetical protein